MSKCISDSSGFMGLTITNLGLVIASALLLVTVCSLVAYSDWQRTEELHAIASDISARIQDMDAAFFEHSMLVQCPQKKYDYTIAASTEYITISAKGSLGGILAVKEHFVIRPWPRNMTMNWTTGSQLHSYLNTTYGHWGTQQDPLPTLNLTEFEQDREVAGVFLALYPVTFQQDTSLTIEKVILVDNSGENHAIILLYQTV